LIFRGFSGFSRAFRAPREAPPEFLPKTIADFSCHSLWTNTMNRCTPHLMAALILLAASASLVSPSALAQTSQAGESQPGVRQFPKAALRGEMMVLAPPIISMDGKADRLSVGSRIRDANNHLVLSGVLVEQKLVVNYLRENTGQVHQVWILNSEEIRQKRPNTKASWFSFGSGATEAPADDGNTPYGQLPAYAR
jgi:hypothetical protein